VRELVGYLWDDTQAELEKLNKIWELDRVFTNYLLPRSFVDSHSGLCRFLIDCCAVPNPCRGVSQGSAS